MSLKPYNYNVWGITPAEYEMLLQASKQGIVTDRQIEGKRYLFILGEENVADFINSLDWGHRFVTNIAPVRDCIDQREFETICLEVIKEYPDVKNPQFGKGEFHFTFLSHAKKTTLCGDLYFDDGDRITGRWNCYSSYGANLPRIIANRISNKIRSARYA